MLIKEECLKLPWVSDAKISRFAVFPAEEGSGWVRSALPTKQKTCSALFDSWVILRYLEISWDWFVLWQLHSWDERQTSCVIAIPKGTRNIWSILNTVIYTGLREFVICESNTCSNAYGYYFGSKSLSIYASEASCSILEQGHANL